MNAVLILDDGQRRVRITVRLERQVREIRAKPQPRCRRRTGRITRGRCGITERQLLLGIARGSTVRNLQRRRGRLP